MARNNSINYSLQLSDIGEPVKSNAGALTIAAAQSTAEASKSSATADAIKTKGAADDIAFLGTTALSAYKGKLESDLTKEIQNPIDRLEGFGKFALANERDAQFPAGDSVVFRKPTDRNPDEEPLFMEQLRGEATRLRLAEEQGTLTREEVLTRIGASVKKYSAMMPGWASDFRKVGAEMTGISNVDVYGIHQALTQKSAREKQAERIQAANLQLLEGFARDNGILSIQEAASPKWEMARNFYQQQKQTQIFLQKAEADAKMAGLQQDEADKRYGTVANLLLNNEVTGLASKLTELTTLNKSSSPDDQVKAKEMSLVLSGEIAAIGSRLNRAVREMTIPSADRPSVLSTKRADEIVSNWRSVLKDYEDAVKNIDGKNMFTALVENANKRKENVLTSFYLAHPHLQAIKDIGVADELFKAYVAVGSDAEFTKRFGPELAKAMAALKSGPGFGPHARAVGEIAKGNSIDFTQLGKLDPNTRLATVMSVVTNVREWAKDPAPTPEKQTAYVNTLSQLGTGVVLTTPSDLKVVESILSAPETGRFLGTLTPAQRIGALSPMIVNAERTAQNVLAQLQNEVAAANSTANKSVLYPNAKVEIVRNSLTGAIEVVANEGSRILDTEARPYFNTTPGGAAVPGTGYFRLPEVRGTGGALGGLIGDKSNRSENIKRAQDLAGKLDGLLQIYTMGARHMSPDLNLDIQTVRQRVLSGQAPAPEIGAVEGLQRPKDTDNANPAGVPAGFNLNKALDAIKIGGEGNNPGLSPKGALGYFQFIEDTGRKYGLKIDKTAGIDERTDPEKSRVAASRFLTDLANRYGGDIAKIAAGYNAGEPAVDAAINKAKALGVPEGWLLELARMGGGGKHSYANETVPYVRRVLEHYQRQR